MLFHAKKTANYKIIVDASEKKYRFFCDVSGALICEVNSGYADDPEEDLRIAWETEGKKHFNQCLKCGRWISDVMYNADVLECVECTPWENVQNYCFKCGVKITKQEIFCSRCGVRLRYEGNDRNG